MFVGIGRRVPLQQDRTFEQKQQVIF